MVKVYKLGQKSINLKKSKGVNKPISVRKPSKQLSLHHWFLFTIDLGPHNQMTVQRSEYRCIQSSWLIVCTDCNIFIQIHWLHHRTPSSYMQEAGNVNTISGLRHQILSSERMNISWILCFLMTLVTDIVMNWENHCYSVGNANLEEKFWMQVLWEE